MRRLIPNLVTVILMAFTGMALASGQDGEPPVSEAPAYSQAELDQMLAPIALYPDVLLSQVLMAATYPLEIVEASRWTQANPSLEGDEAVQAVADKNWDPSVKALVGFPDLIQQMDENLTWTRQLGDAFLLQEEAVMETVQRLRQKASTNGSLAEMDHVTIERQATNIVIEPSNVEVVYVPYYSTRVVYGDWWWRDHPPVYWDSGPSYSTSIGFHWSRGFRVSTDFYYSTCYWPRRSVVVIDRNRHRHHDRYDFDRLRAQRRYDRYTTNWRHDPFHRRGVRYTHESLYDRYGHKRATHHSRYLDHRDRRPISTIRPDRDQPRSVRQRPGTVTWDRPSDRRGNTNIQHERARSANERARSNIRRDHWLKPDREVIPRERVQRDNRVIPQRRAQPDRQVQPQRRGERIQVRSDRIRDSRRERSSVATNRSRAKPPASRPERSTRTARPPKTEKPPERTSKPSYAANPRYTEGNRRATELRRDRLSRDQRIRRSPIRPRDP